MGENAKNSVIVKFDTEGKITHVRKLHNKLTEGQSHFTAKGSKTIALKLQDNADKDQRTYLTAIRVTSKEHGEIKADGDLQWVQVATSTISNPKPPTGKDILDALYKALQAGDIGVTETSN